MDFMEENMKGCINDDDLMKFSTEIVVTRGNDIHLIPVWDMMNHGTEGKININSTSVHSKEGVHVFAEKRIQKGEELYFDYYGCADCDDTYSYWGTPEMMRDFGFVDNYRQTWIFLEQDIGFDLYEEEGQLKVRWDKERHKLDTQQEQYLKYNLDRLLTMGDGYALYFSDTKDIEVIPSNEWNVIMQYYRSIVVALQTILKETEEERVGIKIESSSSEEEL